MRSRAPERRRRGLLWLVIVAAVIVLGVAAVLIWQGNQEPEDQVTPPPVTITNELPTPAVSPIPKTSGSEFYDLLPEAVLQYALSASEEDTTKDVARAVEAYTLEYSDGASASITVTASQWESPKQAVKVAQERDAVAAEADPEATVTETAVEIDGKEVGTATQRLGESEGQVTWSNGTAVLTAAGPAADIENFFKAFPV